MSHIANAINSLITNLKPPMTGADLARTTGIQAAQISRIRNGRQIWVRATDLEKIAFAVCRDSESDKYAKIHAGLLLARLQDECSGPGAPLISITLDDAKPPLLRDSTQPRRVLPPSVQADLDLIAENITGDDSVRDLVSSVANLCRRRAETLESC
jgi:hypothetical protein